MLVNAGMQPITGQLFYLSEGYMTFFVLAKTNELAEGFKRSVKLSSVTLLIFYQDGELYIIEDRCPHMDVPLATGTLETSEGNSIIRCRAHGIAFDLASGKAEGMWSDTLSCLNFYAPVYREYTVGVEIDDVDDDRE